MLALTCRLSMGALKTHLPQTLDRLTMNIYHYCTPRQISYFEKQWRACRDDAIMISRWKGYLLRLVYGDLRDWDILPVSMGNFLSLSDVHRFGILLWCSRQPQWHALRLVIIYKYPEIRDWMAPHCNEWYLEDLSINFLDDMKHNGGYDQKIKWRHVFSSGFFGWGWDQSATHRTSCRNEIIRALGKKHRPACEKEHYSKRSLHNQCGCLSCLSETEVEHWRNYPIQDRFS